MSFHFYNAAFRANVLLDIKPQGMIIEYLKTFSPTFLFVNGDTDLMRNPIQAGEISLFLAPFLLLGLTQLKKLTREGRSTLLIWLLVAPIPAAISGYGDHALRNSLLIVPLCLLAALGLEWLVRGSFKSRLMLATAAFTIFAFALQLYGQVDYYFNRYTKNYAILWGEQSREAVNFALQNESRYERIVFVDSYSSMLSFWAFETGAAATSIQNAILSPEIFERIPVKRIGKFYFVPLEEEKTKNWFTLMPKGTLIIDTHFYLQGEAFVFAYKQEDKLFQYMRIN